MPTNTDRKLRVFLCHSSQDKPVVRDLYQRLLSAPWLDPWLDEEKLIPGQDWDLEIEKAVEAADAVIVLVSNSSVSKEGYVQKELRKVLDIALEKPEETIFIIPLRLDDCELPRRLRARHYVDYFPAEKREQAYQRLLQALKIRFRQLDPQIEDVQEKKEIIKQPKIGIYNRLVDLVSAQGNGRVDIGGSILLIVYFAIAALDRLTSSSDIVESMLAIAAILAGIALLWSRQIPASSIFKLSLIVYLLLYGFSYRLSDDFPISLVIAGIGAVIAAVILTVTIRMPRKPAFYSSVSFAAFLFLVAIYEIVTNFDYSLFTTTVDTMIFLTSIVASALFWMDL